MEAFSLSFLYFCRPLVLRDPLVPNKGPNLKEEEEEEEEQQQKQHYLR